MVFEKSAPDQQIIGEGEGLDYERDCFKNLRDFVRAFHVLESARVKKSFNKQGEQVSSALTECRVWYFSAVNFLVENRNDQIKIQRFWDGLEKQIDRISPESGIMYFEAIQTNIARQSAAYQIFQEIAAQSADAALMLSGDREMEDNQEIIDLSKIFSGVDRVQTAEKLDSEFPPLELILPSGTVVIGSAAVEKEERKRRFATHSSEEEKRYFYVLLGKNDYDRATGQPKAKVLDLVRREFGELIGN